MYKYYNKATGQEITSEQAYKMRDDEKIVKAEYINDLLKEISWLDDRLYEKGADSDERNEQIRIIDKLSVFIKSLE
jgi:hypothetical protein